MLVCAAFQSAVISSVALSPTSRGLQAARALRSSPALLHLNEQIPTFSTHAEQLGHSSARPTGHALKAAEAPSAAWSAVPSTPTFTPQSNDRHPGSSPTSSPLVPTSHTIAFFPNPPTLSAVKQRVVPFCRTRPRIFDAWITSKLLPSTQRQISSPCISPNPSHAASVTSVLVSSGRVSFGDGRINGSRIVT